MPDPASIATVLRESFMAEVHPVNRSDARFYFVGQMVDADHQRIAKMSLVIDDNGRGQHWYFCGDCQTVFACNASCPTCGRSVRAEKPDDEHPHDGLVQTMHSHPQG